MSSTKTVQIAKLDLAMWVALIVLLTLMLGMLIGSAVS